MNGSATSPMSFVLVHGAWWSGDWWWSGVTERLQAAGHRVYTPTLTGLGSRAHLLSADIDLSTHIRDVTSLIAWERLQDIVLVGHSYAGMVISGVAEQVPAGTIRCIVYLDAFLPEDGQCLADIADNIDEVVGDADPVPPPIFFAGGDEQLEAILIRGGTPQPRACFFEPLELTGARDRIPHKSFIWAYNSPVFARFHERLRTDPAWHVEQLSCGHMVMIEQPLETAQALLRAAGA